jgi:ubiquinone/menaquinone biosynthesis C-methylase UbiE
MRSGLYYISTGRYGSMTGDYSINSINTENSSQNPLFSEKVRDEAIMKVKTEFGKTAADIGAGIGFMTEGLLNAGLNVIIVESSDDNIKFLKQRFGHFSEVQIVKSSLPEIDINDNSVDYIFSNMNLHDAVEPEQLIKEMHRLLRPGGKLAITDLSEHRFESFQKEHKHRWPGFNMPDLYEWFVKSGLKEITIEVLDHTVQTESSSGESIKIGVFLAYGEKQ